VRNKLELSQSGEQGLRRPSGAGQALLAIAAMRPACYTADAQTGKITVISVL